MKDDNEATLIEKFKKKADEIWEKDCKENFRKILQNLVINESNLDFIKNEDQFEKSLKNFDEQFQKHFDIQNNQINELFKNQNQYFEKAKINNDINAEENDFSIFNIENEDSIPYDEYSENLKKPLLVVLKEIDDCNILLNPILHCLTQLRKLIGYYLNPKKYDKICAYQKKNLLTISPFFVEIIKAIWKPEEKFSYNGHWKFNEMLKQIISENNGTYFTKDPGMLIRYILIRLHNELDNEDPNEKFIVDKNNENSEIFIFNDFLNFRKKHTTKIQNLFFSQFKISQICKGCNLINYNFESISVIDIYLKNQEAENKKNLQKDIISLIDDDNDEIYFKKYCKVCGEETYHSSHKELLSTNEIIVFNINRSFDKEKMISLDYPEYLDLSKVGKSCFGNYELCSVIKNKNNIYYTYCRSFVDNKWYSFNNEKISLLEDYKQYIFDDKNSMLIIYSKQ